MPTVYEAWAELFLEVTDKREFVCKDGGVARTHDSSIGIAARVGSGSALGHAATPGCGRKEAAFCLGRAETKAAITLPRAWVTELANQSQFIAEGMDAKSPSLDAEDTQLRNFLLEIQEILHHLPSGSKFQVLGFVETQAVSIVKRNTGQELVSDLRRRWGVAVDILARMADGRINWIERSRGGFGGPNRAGIRSLIRELRRLDEQIENARIARPVQSGRFDIAFTSECASLFFHEVVGHFCEESTLIASGKTPELDRKVGPVELNIDDDATQYPLFGSHQIDDIGRTSQRIPLIVDGRLSGLLLQDGRGDLGHLPIVPCSIRQDFRHPPLARMSNTIVEPGSGALVDFVADMRKGILVTKLTEGSVDAHSGNCIFVAAEAFLIQNGKIGTPLRRFIIEGNGAGMLKRVKAVGSDIATVASYCTGRGGLVPVGGLAASCMVRSLSVRPMD